MTGRREKPDFIVDSSGNVQDVRHVMYSSSQVPPGRPPGNGSGSYPKPPSSRQPKRTIYFIPIPIGLIIFLLFSLIRHLNQPEKSANTFGSEGAYGMFQSGNHSFSTGDYDMALVYYGLALDSEPDVAEIYNRRGLVFRARGDYDRALADFDRALELAPESATVYNNRGITCHDMGDYEQAIAGLGQAIELQPNLGKAYYNRGLVYLTLDDYDQVIVEMDQAIEHSSRWVPIPASEPSDSGPGLLAGFYEELEATQSAAPLPWAQYYRGLAYLAKGEYDSAIADLEKAGQLEPGLDAANEALTLAYAALAQTPGALAVPRPSPSGAAWPTETPWAVPTKTVRPVPTSRALPMESWTCIGLVGGNVMTLAIDPVSPTTLYAGMADDHLFKSTDGGKTWSAADRGLSATSVRALVIGLAMPSTLYAGTDGGVYKSTNGGGNWVNAGLISTDVSALVIDPVTPATLYAGSDRGGVYRSTDGAGSWSPVNTGQTQPQVIALAIDPTTPNILYAGTHSYTNQRTMRYYPGNVLKSTDGGRSWSSVIAGYTYYRTLAIDPVTPATLYVGTSEGFYRSADGGGSWSTTEAGLGGSTVFALAVHPMTTTILYAGTNDGVYKSLDGGRNWISVNTGLTNTDVRALAIDPAMPSTVYAGTWGSGVFVLQQEDVP